MRGTWKDVLEYLDGEKQKYYKEYNDACIGITEHCPGRPRLVIYDAEKCIQILVKSNRWSYEDAYEHLYFNVTDVWHGDDTPIFI